MIILPPDLVFDEHRYIYDLVYRHEHDMELVAERSARLQILFSYDYDYRYTDQCYES